MAKAADLRDVHVERYYPSVLANAREFAAIAQAENPELRALWQAAWKWQLNTFVYSFDTDGARRWEQMLGLRPKAGEDLETRRRRILAKINAVLPYTYRRLEEMLDALCGAGRYELAVAYAKRELYLSADPDVTDGLNQVSKLLRAVVPANLALYIALLVVQAWRVRHTAESLQFVDAHHIVWNLGAARSVRRDGEYDRSGLIRYSGIHPDEKYRELQAHQATCEAFANARQLYALAASSAISQSVETNLAFEYRLAAYATQQESARQQAAPQNSVGATGTVLGRQERSYRIVNLRDGSFCRDGSHTRTNSSAADSLLKNLCTIKTIRNGMEAFETV